VLHRPNQTQVAASCSRSRHYGKIVLLGSLDANRAQLEERVKASLRDVVLEAFVDPEPVAVEDRRRRPDGRAEKEPEQTPTPEPGERVVHEPAGLGWLKLGRVHRQRPAASTDDPWGSETSIRR
jgi:hypothetical protein